MKEIYTLSLFLVLFNITPAQIIFQKTLYAASAVSSDCFKKTGDGGYIACGYGSTSGNVFLMKLDSIGDTLWTKHFGGAQGDYGLSVFETADGGYAISGYTYSFGAGNSDAYLIKTDNNGTLQWSKSYGGLYAEDLTTVKQTSDGGYILLGSTASFGSGPADFDLYLIKTDINGDTLWTKKIGGANADYGLCLELTTDSGFIITGYTNSIGAGQDDVFLVKVNAAGTVQWTKTYGGAESDAGSDVQQTNDGGYILTGKTHSFGAFSNDGDVYLVKTNATGDTLWSKTFGGSGTDWGYSVKQTTDDGYVLCGWTYSFGAGNIDVYLIKTDSLGNLLWSITFGGTSWDYGYSIVEANDNGYIIAANTSSFPPASGYLIKTNAFGFSGCNENNVPTLGTSPLTQVTNQSFTSGVTNSIVTTPNPVTGSGCVITNLCNNVGINDFFTDDSFLIYPNPALETVTIKTGRQNLEKIQIFSIPGVLLREHFSSEFSIADLDKGVYIIITTTNKFSFVNRLIKQ